MLRARWGSNKYQFYSLWFDPTGVRTQIYNTRGEHANYYATDAVQINTSILSDFNTQHSDFQIFQQNKICLTLF